MTKYLSTCLIAIFISAISFGQTNKKSDSLQFVEIRGKKQYYVNKGEGNPVVVFVSGLGPTMDDFFEIQNKISKTTQTFCYDRAGVGKSEPFNNDRSLENISSELKELLEKVEISKPFILVGHSRGGLIARFFANKYPDKICGLILIDPALPEHRSMKRSQRTDKEKVEFDAFYNSFCTDSIKYSATIRSEFNAADSASISGKNFPSNIPITILASNKITKDKYSKADTKIKVDLLNAYLKTAPQIKLILTNKSGHFIHEDEPKLVVKEILLMINKIK
jgi:pimeloyl-ACP methyl ester carboxylesterase